MSAKWFVTATVLLALIGLLLSGSTQVYAQGYGDTRQVQELRSVHVGSWLTTFHFTCPYCGSSRTSYIEDRNMELYSRWRYERFNARHGVWVTTGYSEWEYLYNTTDEGDLEVNPCPNLSCNDGPEYVLNGQRPSTYYALCRLRFQVHLAI